MENFAETNHFDEETHLYAENIYSLRTGGMLLQMTLGRALSKSYHDHDFYEIICVLEGSCKHLVDGTVHSFDAGCTAFICPKSFHKLYEQTKDTNVLALSVKEEIMRLFLEAYGVNPENRIVRLRTEGLQQIRQVGESLFSSEELKNNTVQIKLLLGQLLAFLLERSMAQEKRIPKSFETLLLRVNTPEAISEGISAFLRLSNFSYSHLCRLTREYLGMTPGEYITSLRLQLAYEMIAYGNESYEDISEKVGFSSISHFTKLIKQRYGMTPAKIRRRNSGLVHTV